MLTVCYERSGGDRSVRTIRFVLFDQSAFEAFEQAWQNLEAATETQH